jgi:hypothetical protein
MAVHFQLYANEHHLDTIVKVIPIPAVIPADLSEAAIDDMRSLRERGLLESLRGGRYTDLPRPLFPDQREALRSESENLAQLIRLVESSLSSTSLFVRAVKLDEARASTTAKSANVGEEFLHLDNYVGSYRQYPEPNFQYFLNVGQLPRVFRIVPISVRELMAGLVQATSVGLAYWRDVPPTGIVAFVRGRYDIEPAGIEEIVVPSGHVAIFDGRSFVHDAGKPDMQAMLAGQWFTPSAEPDIVIALDSTRHNLDTHLLAYNPHEAFASDLGTSWEWFENAPHRGRPWKDDDQRQTQIGEAMAASRSRARERLRRRPDAE